MQREKYEKNIGKDFERNKENQGVKPTKKYKIVEVLCPNVKERSRHSATKSPSMKRLLILLTKEMKLKIIKM